MLRKIWNGWITARNKQEIDAQRLVTGVDVDFLNIPCNNERNINFVNRSDYYVCFFNLFLMRVLDKKIQKVLSMKTTQSDIQEALDSFAEYYDTTENTVDSRKILRYSLEGISCDLTKRFATELTKFNTVVSTSNANLCRCLKSFLLP